MQPFLLFLLAGSILYAAIRRLRGHHFFDPGPRSLKEMVEQNRAIIHPDDD